MDPTPSHQVYGERNSAALRSISPTGHNIYKRVSISPPRIQSLDNQRTYKPSIADELQTLEDRRADELRQQIREKEAELAQISQSKDRLKLRIENSLNFRNPTAPMRRLEYTGGHTSPLRKSVETSKHSIMKESTRKFQNEVNINKSTISAFRLNPATLSSNGGADDKSALSLGGGASSTIKPQPGGQSDYTRALIADNQQLQRRLNLVTAELDKTVREKATLDQQLISYENETQQYQIAIEDEHRNDGAERDLQAEVQRQREYNSVVKQKIHEHESQRQSVVHNLNMLRGERERKVTDSENLSYGLTEKLRVMRELEDTKLVNIDRMQALEDEIRATEWGIADAGKNLPEMQKVHDRLVDERNDLSMKLDNLSQQYDHTVADYNRERRKIEMTTGRSMRIMSSKAMGKALTQIMKDRKQRVLNEFFNYCRFDQNCHKSLTQLANVMEKAGHDQMKSALHKWFKVCLKPIATRQQGNDLAGQFFRMKQRQRFFKQWQQKQYNMGLEHEERLRAVVVIWHFIGRDMCQQSKLSFTRWRDMVQRDQQRKRVLKLIFARHHAKDIRRSFVQWQMLTQEIAYAIKHHLLVNWYADASFKQVAFSQLRSRIALHKRARQMQLAHVLKAWRDSRAYSKFVMGADVAASHMRRNLDKRLMQACWQQLRLHKASEKFAYMQDHLTQKTVPEMERLDEEIRQQANDAYTSKKLRCLLTLSKHGNCKLASYFNHWSDVRAGTNEKIQKNLRQILRRWYSNSLQKGFQCWKNGQHFSMIDSMSLKVDLLCKEGKKIGKEVTDKTREVDEESARVGRNKRSALQKAAFTCIRRWLEYGIRTWHDKVHRMHLMEQQGSAFIIARLRKRLCKQGFELYKRKVLAMKLGEQADNKCVHYIRTKHFRSKRVVFNAICQYVCQFRALKGNGQLLMTAMGSLLKRKAYKTWQEQGNLKALQLKKAEQNQNTQKFDGLNEILGEASQKHTSLLTENQLEKRKLKNQGQKVLANAFARYYYVKANRGFNRWRDWLSAQKHRASIIDKISRMLTRSINNSVKRSWENWLAQSKKDEITATIKHSEILSLDASKLLEHNRAQHNTFVKEHDFTIDESTFKKSNLQSKKDKIAATFARKNAEHNYMSKFRFVFIKWRAHTARQKQFVCAVNRTILKSMWQNGFDNVSAFARDKHTTRIQNKHLSGMCRMFAKKRAAKALNQWRYCIWANCVDGTVVLTKTCDEEIEHHKTRSDKIKEWTSLKGLKYLRNKSLTMLFKAWKRAIEEQKSLKHASRSLRDHWNTFMAKRELKRWHQRVKTTRFDEDRHVKFGTFRERLYKQAVYDALQRRNYQNRQLPQVLANVASKFNSEALEHCFKQIGYHGDNRQRQSSLSKDVGARQMSSVLSHLFTIKLRSHVSHLRKFCLKQKERVMKIQSCFSHWSGMGLREAFLTWMHCVRKEKVVEDVNDEGPIVVEAFDWMQRLKGCDEFMKDQGYTTEERRLANTIGRETATERLQRVVARLQHNAEREDDQHLKPRVFDRWVQFVKLRRVVRRILTDMGNRLTPQKADLSIAFNRWKRHRIFVLSGKDRRALAAKAGNQKRQMENIAQMLVSADEFKSQMEIQRDELIGNYIKSQRLAIALAKANKERALHCAMNEMSDHKHNQKKSNYEQILQRNIELIESLKSKITDFERDNTTMADENEELRQFSLDGYQIAKNVSQMNEERDRLSIDLADKSRTIQELLDTNAHLSDRLKHAQENAILLINRSSHHMRQMHHTH